MPKTQGHLLSNYQFLMKRNTTIDPWLKQLIKTKQNGTEPNGTTRNIQFEISHWVSLIVEGFEGKKTYWGGRPDPFLTKEKEEDEEEETGYVLNCMAYKQADLKYVVYSGNIN